MSAKIKIDVPYAGGKLLNCRVKDGVLEPALSPSLQSETVFGEIIAAAYSVSNALFFICTSGKLTVWNGQRIISERVMPQGSPFILEDTDGENTKTVIINGGTALEYSRNGFTEYEYGASLRCGIMHCGRLFGADADDGFKLRWSGEGGICDWAEGLHGSGSLNLDPQRGEILEIKELGERLVLVRRFGLTVLSMFGAPENFAVVPTDSDTDEIISATAKVAGGKLYFCTSSGVYAFNGSYAAEVENSFKDCITNPVCAAAYGDKYFLGGGAGGVLLCFDAGGAYCAADAAAEALCVADGLYIFNGGGVYRLAEGGGYKFESGIIDFGTGARKTVTEIYIHTEGVRLEIESDRAKRIFYNVSGSVRPDMRGKKFRFRLTGSSPVRAFTATAEVMDAI